MTDSNTFYVTAVADNKADINNTLSSFKIRLKHAKQLTAQHSVALTSAEIPFNTFNIAPDTYCTVIRSVQRTYVFDKSKGSDIEVINEQPYRMISLDYLVEGNIPHVLEYAIRFKLKEGYYSSVNAIKDEMQSRARQMFQNHDRYLVKGNFQGLGSLSLERGIDGLRHEYLIGKTIRESKINNYKKRPYSVKEDSANNIMFFDRIMYEPHTQKVVFNQDTTQHSERYFTRFVMSPSLAEVFGFYNNLTLDLTHRYHMVPNCYQVKIIPNELFFIYTDIIQPQIISGDEQPLLRILPVINPKVEYGSYLNYQLDNHEYVKPNTRVLDYIRFWITDIQGNPIKFQDTSKTVILKLKFTTDRN